MSMFAKILERPLYHAVLAAVSVSAGVSAYLAADKLSKGTEETAEAPVEEESKPDIPPGETESIVPVPYNEKPDILDYTKFFKENREDQEEAAEEEAAESGEEPAVEDPTNAKLISEAEYLEASGKYAKADATYFRIDGILAGWNNALNIQDPVGTVGLAAIAAFEDPEVKSVYVRNEDLLVDYEIVASGESYEEAVAEASASVR